MANTSIGIRIVRKVQRWSKDVLKHDKFKTGHSFLAWIGEQNDTSRCIHKSNIWKILQCPKFGIESTSIIRMMQKRFQIIEIREYDFFKSMNCMNSGSARHGTGTLWMFKLVSRISSIIDNSRSTAAIVLEIVVRCRMDYAYCQLRENSEKQASFKTI